MFMVRKRLNRMLTGATGLAMFALTMLPGTGLQHSTAQAASASSAGNQPAHNVVAQVASSSSAPQDSITVSAPANISESDDYATQVLGDPWDMNNLTDIHLPYHYSAPTLGNGIWSAVTTGSGAELYFQDPNLPEAYTYPGEKNGVNYPIDTGRFTHLEVRMYSDQASPIAPPNTLGSIFYWYKNPQDTAPCSNCNSAHFPIYAGWHVYDIDLNDNGGTWSSQGTVAGLRMDAPIGLNGDTVKYDWARLVSRSTPAVTITWQANSSASTVNLYLSTDPDPTQDNELLIASQPIGQNSYSWTGAGMAPGTYYIHAVVGSASASSGPLTVNTAPVVQIDAPSPLSGEDFAEAVLNQEWNGSNTHQFQLVLNVTNLIYGADYLQGTSQTTPNGLADPSLYWLYPYNGGNPNITIDTSRYRYASVKLWLAPPANAPQSNWNAGPRMVYAINNAHAQQVTEEPLETYNSWNQLVYDMVTVPKAPNPQESYGWTGTMNMFRFNPHEIDNTSGQNENLPFFRMGGAHLMSEPIAGPSTLIRWHKYQGAGTVSFYYDTDNSGFNGTPIPSAQNVPIDQGSAGWNTANLPQGANLYVYAVANDGANTSKTYSLLPVTINHSSSSTIFDDVPTNYSLANYVNDLAVRGIINGYPQFDNTVLFKPGNSATRAQLSKMVVLGAGYSLVSPAQPTFMDINSSSPLYPYVETAAAHGIISGYVCGGPSEPCDGSGRNYFRPNNPVTRAQTTKMIDISRGWAPANPATPSFRDIDASSPLYGYVEAAVQHNILGGYACGGANEPCPGAYFRPNANVTRAQISKMLSLALPPLP